MSDLIDRYAATQTALKFIVEYLGGAFNEDLQKKLMEQMNAIPPAQPEPSTEIQEILDYLDATLHPIVSSDNWNVYAELHDMVSKLPSAEPLMQGLVCPVCGRGLSPFTSVCPCKSGKGWEITC